jgi:thiosulfate reductase cytochrome b subunit
MAVLDFVFDILILVLPIPVISGLQMGKSQKYSIIGIFWLGSM